MRGSPVTRPLVALILMLASAPAGADEVDDRIEEMAATAHADYLTGAYEPAAALLMRAYRLRPVPKLLFNAAKAYEKAGLIREAGTHFRLFLAQVESDNPLMPKAQEALAGLPGGGAPPPPEQAPDAPAPPARPSSRGRATAAFGLAGAAMIAGTAFGLVARSTHDEFQAETALADRQELRDSARRNALLADLSWVLATAAAVTGVLLWPSDGAEAAAVGASPTGAWLRTTW